MMTFNIKLFFYIILLLSTLSFSGFSEEINSPNTTRKSLKEIAKYYKNKKYNKTIELCTELIKQAPETASAYRYRAAAYIWQKEFSKVIADASSALKLAPEDCISYLLRGMSYFSIREFDKSIQNLSKVMELEGKVYEIYYSRGLAYYYSEQYDKAISDFSKAMNLKPFKTCKHFPQSEFKIFQEKLGYEKLYHYRGLSYLYSEQYKKAIEDLSYVISLDENSYKLFLSRGSAYFGLGQYDKAISDFSYSIMLGADKNVTYKLRGMSYFYNEQYDKGIKDFSYLIDLNHGDDEIYRFRGLAYFFMKQNNKAVKDLSGDNSLNAKKALAVAYAELKHYEKAIEKYSEVIEIMQKNISEEDLEIINFYLETLELCIVGGKPEKFDYFYGQFEKNSTESKLATRDLLIKRYLLLIYRCITSGARSDIEKELEEIIKNNQNIDLKWSFDRTEEWFNNSKGVLTPEEIKYIRDLTDKIKSISHSSNKNKQKSPK